MSIWEIIVLVGGYEIIRLWLLRLWYCIVELLGKE